MGVVEWAANIESFSDLSKISFTRVEGDTVIFGLDYVADYKNPPGMIAGIYSENRSKDSFEANKENIKLALAYWENSKLLRVR